MLIERKIPTNISFIFSDIIICDVSVTVKSDNPTYNKIGADVLLKFEVRSGQQTYNDTNIRIEASNVNEFLSFKPLVDIKFNGDQPIINSNIHLDFKDRVQAEFTDAVVRVTIKNSIAKDYSRDYQCTASRNAFDEQFRSVKLLQASKKRVGIFSFVGTLIPSSLS